MIHVLHERSRLCLCWQQSCYNSSSMPRSVPVRSDTKPKTQGPGRPKVHVEAWAKVSIVLFARQITHLDRFTKQARKRGHKSLTRASIIRGLIDGLLNSGLDVSLHDSESMLREHITKRLRD
jgi:hypothetical protein